MKVALFAYSRRGCRTACAIKRLFEQDEVRAFTMERFEEAGFDSIRRPAKPFYAEQFAWADALVFVGSCGIAVREVAPHVRDKRTDPAVVCVDELGRFAVSLLSGHIGGANGLAHKIANHIDAVPVITTATDINDRFSVDAWAARNGFAIADIRRAKTVSAAILERDIPLSCDFPIMGELPHGVFQGEIGDVGICITCGKREPFERTLRLIPKLLHVGIGCRRGVSVSAIRDAVDAVLAQNRLDARAVKRVASIDLKADEEALLAYCERAGVALDFYSPEELMAVPGEFTSSEFVQSVTGVDTVCERAALIGADRLLVKKTAINGVTVAIATEELEVCFG